MPINKISGLVNLPAPALPVSVPAGGVFPVPAGQGIIGGFGSVLAPQIASGNPLTGQYMIQLGQYTVLQEFDASLQYWRDVQVMPGAQVMLSSDGTNFRIANTTGTPVGALITAAGSTGTNGFYGYVTGNVSLPLTASTGVVAPGAAVTIQNGAVTAGNAVFTITPSAGGSQWNAIVGGAVNTTISFSGTVYQSLSGVTSAFGGTGTALTASAGSNYTKPPIIIFTPPPNQGLQPYILPCAVATISGGAINAVTVTQQGAGLLGLPGITVIPQPGDSTGGGALLGWLVGNSGQVGSGTVLAMWPSYNGTAVTAVPTFTYGGTSNPSPTATAIMNFTVTSITNTTPGSGYTNAYGLWQGGIVSGSAANTNPLFDKGLSLPVFAPITVAATTGVTTLSGPFGGVNLQAVPTLAFGTQLAAGTVTTVAVQTPVVGGASDTIVLVSV